MEENPTSRPGAEIPCPLPLIRSQDSRRGRAAIFGFRLLFGTAFVALGVLLACDQSQSETSPTKRSSKEKLTNPLDADRAFGYLEAICDLGPRIAGTPAMVEQQDLLQKHFESFGAKVSRQPFSARHPQTGQLVELSNLIVEWRPDSKDRILLCTHFDTRPFPELDPNPQLRASKFLGANDGASGVALFMELAHHHEIFDGDYGIDFVCFDAEELVFENGRDPYFLGSQHFAKEYIANPPPYRYACGALVDMIGDSQLEIYQEAFSTRWPDTNPIVREIWDKARKLGVREFIPRIGHEIKDDHLALRNVAKIPTCDIIDFDYPRRSGVSYWHTTKDIPANCSGKSLAKVGWVLLEWSRNREMRSPRRN